jgi:hypothetical protein
MNELERIKTHVSDDSLTWGSIVQVALSIMTGSKNIWNGPRATAVMYLACLLPERHENRARQGAASLNNDMGGMGQIRPICSPSHQSDTLYGVNCRLSRLNWIYRQCSGQLNVVTFIRGYAYGYNLYSVFLERNFAWLLAAIVLTATQIGFGTNELNQSGRLQAASYGFN